jgi:hypothetical protein
LEGGQSTSQDLGLSSTYNDSASHPTRFPTNRKLDEELQCVIDAWADLPAGVRKAVLAIVEAGLK